MAISSANASVRDPYWDQVKGIAILAVITIHSCYVAGLPQNSFALSAVLAWRQIANFAVPVFLAVSGYLAGRSKSPKDWHWVFRRLGLLLPAYLFWTIVFVLLFHRRDLIDPVKMMERLFFGTGIGIGYFVIVLVQMTFLTPLIDRVHKSYLHVLAMITLTVLGISFTYTMQLYEIEPFNTFPMSALFFAVWYPFYHLGYFAGKRDWNPSSKAALGLAIITLALSFAEAFFWKGTLPAFAASQTKATSLAFSLSITLLILANRDVAERRSVAFLAWLGRASYFVYLFHLIPVSLSKTIAHKVGLPKFTLSEMLFVAMATILISILAAFTAQKTVPSFAKRWVLG